jgi:4-diphosphocytidyl-2-C-methyl-D-erythritol kinase
VIIPAPAKLNLFLHITGRRDDGYHLLQSIFQFIDLCDTVTLDTRQDGEITCHSALNLPPQQDLAWRAAKLLQTHTQSPCGADIRIDKNIPVGGGLGGGSSNAASVLLGLNQLWALDLPGETLAQLGLQLGADVPIFIHGRAAWVEGIGEKISPLESLAEPWYIVLHPGVHVSTAEIFCNSELTRDKEFCTIHDFSRARTENVCEAVAIAHYPVIAEALAWLGQFAKARMSGTGACIFAAFDNEMDAKKIARQSPWQAWVAKALNQSPAVRVQ